AALPAWPRDLALRHAQRGAQAVAGDAAGQRVELLEERTHARDGGRVLHGLGASGSRGNAAGPGRSAGTSARLPRHAGAAAHTNRGSGIGTTKRPPQSRTSESCATISASR